MQDKFIVPQFIDSEDKIWGPITVRQFVTILVGALFEFVAYKMADMSLFILESVFIIVFVIVIAFVKINGAPFHVFALNFIETFKKAKIRVWHKEYMPTAEFKDKKEDIKKQEYVAKKGFLPNKKLSELSLVIDTGGAYKGQMTANQQNNSVYNIKQYEK
jgi:hypothetical protein